MEIPTQQKTKIVNDIVGDGESMVISSKNTFKRNRVVNDSDEDGEGINIVQKWFLVFKINFLIILIAGNESNFTIKESMVLFPKNHTKRSKIVNDIDGGGDKDDGGGD